MKTLDGIGGTLFPLQFLTERLSLEAGLRDAVDLARRRARARAWWGRVAASCGPATGLRAIFDLAAMPLAALLGFRCSSVLFDRATAQAALHAPSGGRVAMLVLPWATRPSTIWRRAVVAGTAHRASWCVIVAPPFVSLVGTGRAGRRSVDFSFPAALEPASFAALVTLAGSDAFQPGDDGTLQIERLVGAAAAFQERVRADLQYGVLDALCALTPVVAPDGEANGADAFGEALTILYRVLFLLFAESRDLVPWRHPIYRDAYAVGTLCRLAQEPGAARGLWEALAAVSRLSRSGCRVDDLIVQPFNGRLFARMAAPSLERRPARRSSGRSPAERDRAIQRTLLALATRETPAGRQYIRYADLGVEQLGAVYERVLDVDPQTLRQPSPRIGTRAPARRHSVRRKQSGTFYTPQDLTDLVVRRTLAPLVAGRSPDQILALRVVDPAMGSGAFLVAACHFLGGAYERALIDAGGCAETDIGPAEQIDIRRRVAERCLAGVDLNPVAVQLARLSLWLATLSAGKPLEFLDHRLRVGNSLVGAAPDDLRRVAIARTRRAGDVGWLPMFDDADLRRSMRETTRPLRAIAARGSDSIDDVRAKERAWSTVAGPLSPLARWRQAADLWCARWFWPDDAPRPSPAELRAAIDAIVRGDSTLHASHAGAWMRHASAARASQDFFHWPLEFADAYYDESGEPRPDAGFDAVIGNPPWEMLRDDMPEAAASPRAAGHLVRFLRQSGLYRSCGRGHVNLYQPFVERALQLARAGGRIGLVLPWGLAVDDGASDLRARLLDSASIDTLVGLDNARALFPIHRGLRFLAVAAGNGGTTQEIRARFGVTTNADVAALAAGASDTDVELYPVRLPRALLGRAGGPSRRIPDVRHSELLELLDRMTLRHRALGHPSGWHARFGRELNITEDRAHFAERGLPVLEGKHIHPFIADAASATARIPRAAAAALLPSGSFLRSRLAYRDVSGVANRLSVIAAIVPAEVVTSHTLFCLRTALPPDQQLFLCAVLNSYVLNAMARMLMGSHVTTSLMEMLPVPAWTGSPAQTRVARLAGRLGRRRSVAVEAGLQAAVAHEYGIDRMAFARVLETLPLVPERHRAQALTAFAL